MPEAKANELSNLLAAHGGERHAVLLQDFPDPDAIACGFAYQVLAAVHKIEVDILYGGRISHQENLAMVNLLSIDLTPIKNGDLEPGNYQGVVLVDGQGTTTRLLDSFEKANIPVLVVVDHHVDQERVKPAFMDLRTVGACCSIFTHYFAAGLLPLSHSDPHHARLATALMHGIISETGSMIRAKPFDFTAAAFLQPYFDMDVLLDVLHQRRSHRSMEVIRISLSQRITREGFCLAGVGYIRQDDRDAIPQAADFLLSEENVHTAIVYGIVTDGEGNESLQGSMRTTKLTINPDAFIKEALGRMDNGHFYGGGKEMAGGFEIPLGFLSGGDGRDLDQIKWEAFSGMIRKRFFGKIGVEEK